ncbi:MAG: SCO family protein [Daejeonella sp.]
MNNTSASLKKILILVTILAVPGFLYYLLQEKGKNRYRPLAKFGPKEIASTFHKVRGKQIPDTIYHTISDFKLTNQDDQPISFDARNKQITVVNFFFTRCTAFCPAMNKEMQRVVQQYEKNKLLRFLSITVDPGYDTPAILKQYVQKYNQKSGKWDFLTGPAPLISKLAKQDFLVDVVKDTTRVNNYIHSSMLILTDPQKRIRGYYDSTNKEEVDKLIDEIKVLITEELRNKK